jgi:hypothetical protein
MEIEQKVILKHLACASCQIWFAIPETFIDIKRVNHKTFYCPVGHGNYFPEKTSEEQLRAALLLTESERDFARNQLKNKPNNNPNLSKHSKIKTWIIKNIWILAGFTIISLFFLHH